MRIFWVLFVTFCCLDLNGTSTFDLCAQETERPNLIKNSSFEWDGEQLTHWEIAQGAGRGPRMSVTKRGDDGSLELNGSERTQSWNYVGQSFPASPGDCFQLSYTAMANGVRQERGQNNNCYAAIFFKKSGSFVGNSFFNVSESEYTDHRRLVTIPAGVDEATVMLFLSMTGTLNFKSVTVQKLETGDSFDALASQMDRYYSYFDHKGIDWEQLTARYRDQANGAETPDDFKKITGKMLAELKDGHVWFMEGSKRIPVWKSPRPEFNFDFGTVDTDLRDSERFGRLGMIGRTDDGIGYVRITSLQVEPEEMQKMIDGVVGLFDTDGIVIDLRANGGGSEAPGGMLASLFCNKTVTYAINRFRKNEKHDEFVEFKRGPLQPRQGKFYDKPVVCLIGPGAVSSAEGTALMFKALPNVKLIGQPTRGSSGNPAGVKLPNGVEMFFSRWVACDATGQPIEDHGVQPDILVEHLAKGDPAWERAKKELK